MTTDYTAPLRDVRWEPPIPGSAWVRRQIVENIPDPLSPLFDELYLHEGLERSTESLLGRMGVSPATVFDKVMDPPLFATVNGYAYMRGDTKLSARDLPDMLRIYVNSLRSLSRIGVSHWRDEGLPSYLATVERWKELDPATASDAHLLRGVRALAWADAEYWFSAAVVLGLAKVTDALLDRFLSVAVAGRGLTSGRFLRGFPSKTLEAEASLEELASRVRASESLRAVVEASPAEQLREALAQSAEGREVLDAFAIYLDRYGHQVYNLDFAEPTQADNPLPLLLSLKALAGGPAGGVEARRQEMARERDRETEATARSLDPVRRSLFRRILGLAQRFGPHREQALFYIGAAWPALRRMALELGARLAAVGTLETPDDIFFLQTSEIEAASAERARGNGLPDLARLARERRELREARKRLHPPGALPLGYRSKVGPIDLSAFDPQQPNVDGSPVLRGIAVSPGRVTAPASVLLSPADFNRMQPNTILVCPTTTPAWTPLFAQARGLVTDIGGILAHGSIVAREYGIPAVLGTGTGTQRISNGQQITVDGDAGTVALDGAEHDAGARLLEERPYSYSPTWQHTRLALAAAALLTSFIWWRRRRSRS